MVPRWPRSRSGSGGGRQRPPVGWTAVLGGAAPARFITPKKRASSRMDPRPAASKVRCCLLEFRCLPGAAPAVSACPEITQAAESVGALSLLICDCRSSVPSRFRDWVCPACTDRWALTKVWAPSRLFSTQYYYPVSQFFRGFVCRLLHGNTYCSMAKPITMRPATLPCLRA